MARMALAAAMVLALAACGPAKEKVPAATVVIPPWGVDLSTRDPAVKPGDDFFRYAQGAWYDKAVIPADRTFTGADLKLDETSKAQVKAIIEEAAAKNPAPGSIEQKIGDYYASWMDEAGVEAKGMAPINAELAPIEALKDRTQLAALIGKLDSEGVVTPVGGYVDIDAKNPTRYIFSFWQYGLSFGERDYYLKNTAEFKDLRAKFLAHVERTLTLAGQPNAKQQAAKILALETKIAKIHWPLDKTRERELTYNLFTRADLEKKAGAYPIAAGLKAAGVDSEKEFIVGQPDVLAGVAKLLVKEPLEDWKSYLRYQVITAYANYGPKALDDESFAFYGTALRGVTEQQPRWKRGADLVGDDLGEAIGKLYVERHFPPEAKAGAEELVANLRAALGEMIAQASWMSTSTKAEAQKKLSTFNPKIGYPNKWKNYDSVTIKRDDLIDNAKSAANWAWHDQIDKLGKPIDRDEWGMTPQTVNAYYNDQLNEIVFPAAILQAPYFDPLADAAVNYGGIGSVIGHEMSHGFDDQGRKSDSTGLLRDWWTKEDAARYSAEADKLVAQFNAFEPLPGLHINGRQTLGENIADLAGLQIAYNAYKKSLNGKDAPVIDGLTGDQRFFLAFAQAWQIKQRDERLRDLVLSDVHSPAMFRVNGTVRDMDIWYAAFGVTPDSKMYIAPEKRVRLW